MKRFFSAIKIASAATALTLTSAANANLIVNGGFEDPVVTKGNWAWFSSVDGWSGSNVEIWGDDFGNIGAYEGLQHAELNAHPNTNTVFSIYQGFTTVTGQQYNLSFAYGARMNNDEAFRVEVGDLNQLMDDHVVNQWSVFDGVFTAQSDWTTLRFTSAIPSSATVGNFLDGVSVTSVPEPGSLALFGLGLAGLGFLRSRKTV